MSKKAPPKKMSPVEQQKRAQADYKAIVGEDLVVPKKRNLGSYAELAKAIMGH